MAMALSNIARQSSKAMASTYDDFCQFHGNNFVLLAIDDVNISNAYLIKGLRLALVQLAVTDDKATNISRAISFVERAKQQGADVVALPECFNSPYGTAHFPNYAENVPAGETSLALSAAAKKNGIYVIGGSIPERDGEKFFNTCTVWDSEGKFIGKYRKVHLFDIDVKGKMTFKESDILTAGNELLTFHIKNWKIGLGICYDIRFEELARLYRNLGCQLMFYPGAFNMTTGPLHWSLLQRARANDAQLYVAGVSPAKVDGSGYVAYGHTQLTDPWGKVLKELEFAEDMIVADIDMTVVDEVRAQIPIFGQRRTDLYETCWKKN
ncbi:omega-amidase NIT2 isoform X1 [Neodiprion virginianus]|uniref:omega-amidase NIT2 isoform X1 n=1 Tax=Neodiprion virginianus TaxID=2961670 RepID=UPI001EE6E6F3|nr:omega-amidase NIT2 isoform X1 [Neodiprion virginianus]